MYIWKDIGLMDSVVEKFAGRSFWWHEVVALIGNEEWRQGYWNKDTFETPGFRVYGSPYEGSTLFSIFQRIAG